MTKRLLSVVLCLMLALSVCSVTGLAESAEPVTLTAFVMQSVATEFGIIGGWQGDYMRENLGIQIEFLPAGDNVLEKLQSYMASGQLPDIVGFKEQQYVAECIEAGLLECLDDHQEELPNVFTKASLDNAIRYWRDKYGKDGDGKLYALPTAINSGSSSTDTNWQTKFKWSAYKALDFPEIETLEDILDICEQMIEIEPETPEGKKTYAFGGFSDWDTHTALEISTLSFFYGIDTEYVSPLMETQVQGEWIRGILDDDAFYKRALHFYWEANQRGLLDPDSISNTFNDVTAKYTNGQYMFSWFSWMNGNYNNEHKNDEEPDGYVYIPVSDMTVYDKARQTVGRNWCYGISSKCENMEAAIKWLNWFYDPETTLILKNGPQGYLWDYNEDGIPYLTEGGYRVKTDNLAWKIVDNELVVLDEVNSEGDYWNTKPIGEDPDYDFGFDYELWPTYVDNPSNMTQTWRDWIGYKNQVAYLKGEDKVLVATGALDSTVIEDAELKAELDTIASQVGAVIRPTSWQMVYAETEEEFEALWKEMQDKANELGYEKYVEAYTEAFEKALEEIAQYEIPY